MSRVVGVSAAGRHHILLLGARGTGKSHTLEWLEHIQLPMSPELQIQHQCVTELALPIFKHQSIKTKKQTAERGPPIRRVGQQIRPAALVGRADSHGLHPGEFTLAQGGLLIADELLEWDRDSREAFREPLERGTVTLTRAWAQVELPARFTLAATGNLCRCGGWPPIMLRQLKLDYPALHSRLPDCTCLPRERNEYISKLSGPLFDRIDLVVRTPPLIEGDCSSSVNEELEQMRSRIDSVRSKMILCHGAPTGELTGAYLEKYIETHTSQLGQTALNQAASLRSRHKTLRVALALRLWDNPDSDGVPENHHIREALSYRGESLGIGAH